MNDGSRSSSPCAIDRARQMHRALLVLAATLTLSASRAATTHAAPSAHAPAAATLTPDKALEQLEAGNKRFVSGAPTHPNQNAARRAEEAKGQHPYAVVIGCSDSRVAPEIVFDAGLGDLFVIRTAGNRLDDLVLASETHTGDDVGGAGAARDDSGTAVNHGVRDFPRSVIVLIAGTEGLSSKGGFELLNGGFRDHGHTPHSTERIWTHL